MRIKVLQHHIDEGSRADAYSCALVLAIREYFPEAEIVVGENAYIDHVAYPLPHEARDFRTCFDRGCKDATHVRPFEFELPIKVLGDV